MQHDLRPSITLATLGFGILFVSAAEDVLSVVLAAVAALAHGAGLVLTVGLVALLIVAASHDFRHCQRLNRASGDPGRAATGSPHVDGGAVHPG